MNPIPTPSSSPQNVRSEDMSQGLQHRTSFDHDHLSSSVTAEACLATVSSTQAASSFSVLFTSSPLTTQKTRTKRSLEEPGGNSVPRQRPRFSEPPNVSGTPASTTTPGLYLPQSGYYPANGSFHGAHGFQFHQPYFVDNVTQNIYSQNQSNPSEVFRRLETHIMPGAEFNSAERDPPPRCHPETRTSILQRTTEWIEDPEREERLLWIRGSAGVGKSAIVQTLAETLSESDVQRLGATLFFSRPNGRSNPQQVFPTLAYHLAHVDSSYKEYISQLMLQTLHPLNKSISEQFRLLIIEPFVRRRIREGQTDLLLAIDGLDECDGDPAGGSDLRGRTSDRVQCEIVRLISGFVSMHPEVPLIWIIASRPETHLTAVFSSQSILNTFREEDIPVDSDEACRDVEKFLHVEFGKIRENYPMHITESPWPSEKKFLQISKAASGLFVFAEVAIRFIDDPKVNNPIAHLEYVLDALSKLRKSTSRQNPLATLDAIYSAILAKVPNDTLPTTKELLSVIILSNGRNVSDFPFERIRECLNLSKDKAVTALHQLHSVMYFPRNKDVDKTRPKFYHASFRDYLGDQDRSQEYYGGRSVFLERALEHSLPRIFDQVPSGIDTIPDANLQWIKEDSYAMLGDVLRIISPVGATSVSFLLHNYPLPDAQLQPILENLNFSQMARTDDLSCLDSLCLWDKQRFPVEELKRRKILSITAVANLGIQSSTVLEKSSVTQLLSSCVLHLGAPTVPEYSWIGRRKDLVKKALASLVSEAPLTEVLVWGYKDREKCAVIRELGVTPFKLKAMYIIGM